MIKTLGTYKKTIYRNYLSGYTVFQLTVADVIDLKRQAPKLDYVITCFGIVPEYLSGTPLYLEGELEETRYGLQINISEIKERTWSVQSAAAYISNSCAGIGPVTATLIAENFPHFFELVLKDDAIAIISAKLSSIPLATIAILVDTIRSTSLQREIYSFIAPYGGNWNAVVKLIKKYGTKALSEIKKNPYIACLDCGVDFYTCDRLAKKTGVMATSHTRIGQAIAQAFESEKAKGHTYSTEEDICILSKKLVRNSVFAEDISAAIFLNALEKDDNVILEQFDREELAYLKYMLADEKDVAFHLNRLMRSAEPLNYDSSIHEQIEVLCGITYAEQQKECFNLIQQSGAGVITGSPGTGKTTILNGIITAYEMLNPNKIIRLCAPTGRAAQRITESTGREAVTIHRLLDYQPFGNDVIHKDASNPIDADFIIVDEASMLDINLAAILLSAVRSGALVLFIGDINQLPSVGPGDVLNNIIQSKCIPTVQLTTIYRQAALSPIIKCANCINSGVPDFPEDGDCRIIREIGVEQVGNTVMSLAVDMYDKANPFETQVLCPSHKGEAGVLYLNTYLQQLLNPPSQTKNELKYGQKIFRVGDKVLFTNNNYLSGYFNGDIGVITSVEHGIIRVNSFNKELVVTKSEMEDLSLAYAFTVHKAQGNEFTNVIVALPLSPRNMLKRNLLYTALTRARKTVTIVSESNAAEIATYTNEAGKRRSKLKDRIIGFLGEQ